MTNSIGNNGYNQYYKPYPYGTTNNGTSGNFSGLPVQETVKEQAKDNAVAGTIMGVPTSAEGWKKYAPYFAAATALSIIITTFANALCKGKFNTSYLKKLGDVIDNSALANSKFVKNVSKKVSDIASSVRGFFSGSKIANEIGDAIKDAPKPKNIWAKSYLNGIRGQGVDEVMKALVDLPDDLAKKFDLTDAIKKLKEGADAFDLFKQEDLLKKLGKLTDDPQAYERLSKMSVNLIKDEPGLFNLWHLFGLKRKSKNVDFNLLVNKVRLLEGEGAKTGIGKAVQKFIIGVTESVGGGVLGSGASGIIMNSLFLAQSLKQAGEAPKGEKVKTFMEDFWGNMVGGFLLIPVVGRTFYKALGVKNLSKHVTSKPVKILLKPLEMAGKVASIGLEKKPAKSIFGALGNTAKGFLGGFARFYMIMMGLNPVITKVFIKGSHAVFGKPTKSALDELEGKGTESTNNNVQPNIPEIHQQVPNPFNQQSNNPLVEQYLNRIPVVNNNQQQSVPAAKPLKEEDEANPPRTYIPSPDPVQLTEDSNLDRISAILNNCDKHAEYAEKLLKEL